jgi:hypothetical protein
MTRSQMSLLITLFTVVIRQMPDVFSEKVFYEYAVNYYYTAYYYYYGLYTAQRSTFYEAS